MSAARGLSARLDAACNRLREMCLALPETSETGSFGHPNFRAGKWTFCTIEIVKERLSFAFRLSPAEQTVLLSGQDPRFFPTPYCAKLGWVSLWVEAPIPWGLIDSLVDQSYRSVALQRMLRALDSATSAAASSESTRPRRRKA